MRGGEQAPWKSAQEQQLAEPEEAVHSAHAQERQSCVWQLRERRQVSFSP
jgi:hypothetical protein